MEGFSDKTNISPKVKAKLEEIISSNTSSGDLALKLNTLLTLRELEKDGKIMDDKVSGKTREEMQAQFGDWSDAEINELKNALESLHHSKKRNYPL